MLEIELSGEGESEDSDIDYEVELVGHKDYTILYGLYSKLRSYLFHYNMVKLKYKILASTWMFAAFVGFGYILSGQEVGLPFSNYVSIAIMSVLAAAGIMLIWILDITVYHRILGAIFIETLVIENKYPTLLNVHHGVVLLEATEKKGGWIAYDGLFYANYLFILNTIGIIALFIDLQSGGLVQAFIVSGIGAVLATIFQCSVYLYSKRSSPGSLFKGHPAFKNLF